MNAKVTVLKDETLGGIEREYAEVKRKARVGERIKIVDLDHGSSGGYYYRLGNVAIVTQASDSGNVHADFNGNDYVLDHGRWSAGLRDYIVLEPTDIVRINGDRLRMVERKAVSGERVVIVNNEFPSNYDIGEVFTVEDYSAGSSSKYAGVYVSALKNRRNANIPGFVRNGKYRVLEPVSCAQPSAQPKPEPSTPSIAELVAITDGLTDAVAKLTRKITELETRVKVTEEDVVLIESGVADEKAAETIKELTRDDVIERAKADVADLQAKNHDDVLALTGNRVGYYVGWDEVNFVVNRDKCTVVALLSQGNHVWARGIAKAAPGDVFNSHIGRAIALRRALGLEVPAEYTSAPQPSEPRVGDIVDSNSFLGVVKLVDKARGGGVYNTEDGTLQLSTFRILSDTRILDDSREADEKVASAECR